jgi:hypothetical protein
MNTFSTTNFFMLNLPSTILVISVLGGIFLFINIIRQDGNQLQ